MLSAAAASLPACHRSTPVTSQSTPYLESNMTAQTRQANAQQSPVAGASQSGTHMQREATQADALGAERDALGAVIRAVAVGVDSRNWTAVHDAFASRVVLDYGIPELLTPAEIVGRWQPLFARLDRTQHEMTIVEIRSLDGGERAKVTSTFVAEHVLTAAEGGDRWTLSGRYEHELIRTVSGWKITRMRMIPESSRGNDKLIEVARARGRLPTPPSPAYEVDHVSFDVGGARMTGVLHLPPGTKTANRRLPALLVTGSWTTVKEQMASLYAARAATAGFAALTFDFRGFGESEGEPRGQESPARKMEDIRGALNFLAANPHIDAQRLGLLAICASSGYAALEAANDPRVRSLAMVAPWLHDSSLLESVYGSRQVYGGRGLEALKAAGHDAAERYRRDGTVEYVSVASTIDARAAMFIPDPKVLEYYLDVKRGGIPQWGNRFPVLSWPEWLSFDAIAVAPRLRVPTLIVHSEAAAIPDGARRFASAMAQPPKMVWMPGTQFDFYDQPETVARASQEAITFFEQTLQPKN
jgi:pimeloyl-ACP methyl ester carboxylesterase